jgi:pyruvate/2-oxoglutarate dehydrogenase complex dihydrolipoamide dehydrogenase (E3) component
MPTKPANHKERVSVPEQSHYEALVIGSGEGGKFLAWHLARSGQRTAVVERRWIGGSCPNINCLPSKNEIWSARVADLTRHAAGFGIATGPVAVDMHGVVARKREMVEGLIKTHLELFASSGAELIMGEAGLTGPRQVEVSLNKGGSRVLTADRLFLCLGTHATIPDFPGLRAARPLTHIEALELDRLPRHLIVVGGGYVGLELSQAFRRFGAEVTVLQAGPQLIPREDPEVAAALLEMLRDDGVTVHLDVELQQVTGRSGNGVAVLARAGTSTLEIEGSDILVAAGRTPNTTGIGLDVAGVELDGSDYIKVSERLETTAPNTWAIGECAGSPQFTHASLDDFRIIRDNLAGGQRSTRDRVVPYCLFTEPPLARVGLSESEAARKGIRVRTATLPIQSVMRSRTLSETRGFLKAVVAAESDSILGFTMLGAEAGEVMAVVQTAMAAGMPYTGLRDAIIAHPTMAEGLGALFSEIAARPTMT